MTLIPSATPCPVPLFLPTTLLIFFFFFNDTATTEIYTLSLHDALPIYPGASRHRQRLDPVAGGHRRCRLVGDRKSTRLNSSHLGISYAVFCFEKKKTLQERQFLYLPELADANVRITDLQQRHATAQPSC